MTLSRSNLTLFVVIAFFGLNFLKVPLAIATGLNHSLLSLLQLVAILFAGCLLVLFRSRGLRFGKVVFVFLIYHALLFFRQIIEFGFDGASLQEYTSALFSFSRLASIAVLYICFSEPMSAKTKRYAVFCILAYLVFTSVIAFLQNPMSPLSGAMSGWLRDSTSGNHLGFFRSTGGVGGTVVDYAVYLSLTGIFFYRSNLRGPFFWIGIFALLVGLFFCFSRSSFMTAAILFLAWNLRLGSNKRLLWVSFLTLCALASINLIYTSALQTFSLSTELAGDSDLRRLDGWMNVFSQMTVVGFFFGEKVGGNTGFDISGFSKLTGDGAVVSHLFDYGIFGVLMLVAVFISFVRKHVESRHDTLAITAVILLLIGVNSGMEKIHNYAYFFIVLSVVGGSHLALHKGKPDP